MNKFLFFITILLPSFGICQQKILLESSPSDAYVIVKAKGKRGLTTPGNLKVRSNESMELTFIKNGYCPCSVTLEKGKVPGKVTCNLENEPLSTNSQKNIKIGILTPKFVIPEGKMVYDGGYSSIYFSHSWAYANNLYYDFKKILRDECQANGIAYENMTKDELEENFQEKIRYYILPVITDMWQCQKSLERGTKLNIEWRVYDKLTSEISHTFYSLGGGASGFNYPDHMLSAFKNATRCMMGQAAFQNFISTPTSTNKSNINTSITLPPLIEEEVFPQQSLSIYEKALASTVILRTQHGYGTGAVVSEDGLVLTDAAIVEGSRIIEIITHYGNRTNARVIEKDSVLQVALLQIADTKGTYFFPTKGIISIHEELFYTGIHSNIDQNIFLQKIKVSPLSDTIASLFLPPPSMSTLPSGGIISNEHGAVVGLCVNNNGVKKIISIERILGSLHF